MDRVSNGNAQRANEQFGDSESGSVMSGVISAGRSEIEFLVTRGPSHLRWGGGEGGNENKKTGLGPGGGQA